MLNLNKNLVKSFEREQKKYGTEIALYNIFWQIAASIFKAAGVTDITTR